MPPWIWFAVGGGGGALLIVIIIVIVVCIVRRRRGGGGGGGGDGGGGGELSLTKPPTPIYATAGGAEMKSFGDARTHEAGSIYRGEYQSGPQTGNSSAGSANFRHEVKSSSSSLSFCRRRCL